MFLVHARSAGISTSADRWSELSCSKQTPEILLPNRPLHNFRTFKNIDRHLYERNKIRRSTDSEAQKLYRGRSGDWETPRKLNSSSAALHASLVSMYLGRQAMPSPLLLGIFSISRSVCQRRIKVTKDRARLARVTSSPGKYKPASPCDYCYNYHTPPSSTSLNQPTSLHA